MFSWKSNEMEYRVDIEMIACKRCDLYNDFKFKICCQNHYFEQFFRIYKSIVWDICKYGIYPIIINLE